MKFSELRPGDLVIWRCDDGTTDADLVLSMGHYDQYSELSYMFFVTLWGNRRMNTPIYKWWYSEYSTMSARAFVIKADSLNT